MVQKSAVIQETGTGTITISAPGNKGYNAITSLSVESAGAASVTVESPSGTTIWQHGITADEGIFPDWDDENPLLGAENSAVILTVSAGAQTLNIRGYVTP